MFLTERAVAAYHTDTYSSCKNSYKQGGVNQNFGKMFG